MNTKFTREGFAQASHRFLEGSQWTMCGRFIALRWDKLGGPASLDCFTCARVEKIAREVKARKELFIF